jgi:hypothetical protein
LSEEPPQARYTTSLTEEFTPYFTAIGRLAIIWAEFEFSINEAIWELANVERFAGTCMTSQMIGPGPRFRCFVSLLRLRNCPAELINKINSLSNVAEGLGRQRNRFLHDPLALDTTDKTIRRMETTADRVVRHAMVPLEIDEIIQLTADIDVADAQFDDLFLRVLAETPPWPRTQFEQSQGIRRQRTPPASSRTTPENPPEPSRA